MMTRAGSGSGRLAGCVGGGEPRPRTSFRIRFGGETVEGFSIVHRLRSRNKGGRRRDAYIVSTSAGGKCNCLCRTAACDGVSRGFIGTSTVCIRARLASIYLLLLTLSRLGSG